MTGDATQVLKAAVQDLPGLRRQVNIVLGGAPGPVSGAYSLIGILVPLACDPFYCYTYSGIDYSQTGEIFILSVDQLTIHR